uniref:Putative ovule protein n=1 Tax=Solanum chacoense TaxID=4108 RepID=A0A0V0ID50_SOLCH
MGLDFPAAWNEQIRHVLVEFVDRHSPVMMEIEAVILSEHRQLLHTINVSEVTDQRARPNQLQVVLVMQEDEDVEMTVINSDDIIPLHNSNELDKQIVDHEEDDLWHVDPLLTHIQNSDIEASL